MYWDYREGFPQAADSTTLTSWPGRTFMNA
jgi:hypothetical protein